MVRKLRYDCVEFLAKRVTDLEDSVEGENDDLPTRIAMKSRPFPRLSLGSESYT